jgi:oligopeptide/dipeptide ABC transporter ATP-binding protein
MTTTSNDILLSVRDISVDFATRRGNLGALKNINLDLHKGEILGLVGESGSGKSTLGKAIMRMIDEPGKISGGELIFDGMDMLSLSPRRMRDIRGSRISMIFQDPMTSLNPVQRIDNHIIEAIRVHRPDISRDEANHMAETLIERLGIGKRRLNEYPHQMSGGMRQRIMIGLALALKADLIIADEPTTSLDVIVEAQFLDLLRELKNDFNLTILLITHNIGVVAELADRVGVMYAGQLVEVAPVHELFHDAKHPYTQGLLQSVPNIELDGIDLYRMKGSPPNLISPPSGCRFHPRCPHMMNICHNEDPPTTQIQANHETRCWLYEEHRSS